MSFTCKDIVPIQFELPASPFVAKGKEKHRPKSFTCKL